MPRMRAITKLVDAMAAQQRVILWLECGHKTSLSAAALIASGPGEMEFIKAAQVWRCEFCEDPPPEAPSAQRLYRQAYEPDIAFGR